MMNKVKEKFLEKSGSYNFYKDNYENLKKQSAKHDKIIKDLKEEVTVQEEEIRELNKELENNTNNYENKIIYDTSYENYDDFSEVKLVNDYKFAFSIIIPFYNSGNYLNQCIDSVINQTINFEKNVEIILVNDGSSDDFLDKINKYLTQYPENIFIHTINHKGQAYARNYGLKYVNGKYVNFLDSDDYLSENTLEEVYKSFSKYDDINVSCIPIKYFGRIDEDCALNGNFNCDNDVLELNRKTYPQITISSVFIRSAIFNNNQDLIFDNNLSCSEETILINRIFLKEERIGIVKSATYHYRKRFDFSSVRDLHIKKESFYTERLNYLYEKIIRDCDNKNNIPAYVQSLFIYEIKEVIGKFNENNKTIENSEIKYTIKHILGSVTKDQILNSFLIDSSLKSFLIYLKNDEVKEFSFDENNFIVLKSKENIIDSFENRSVYINKIQNESGYLSIWGNFESNIPNDKFKLELVKKYTNKKTESFNCIFNDEITYNFDNKCFLGENWEFKNKFYVKVPLKKNEEVELSFNISLASKHNQRNLLNLSFTEYDKYYENNEIILNPYKLRFNNYGINISRAYNFSIVIAVYNTEKYIREAIDSVINQTLDFEDNVQLILVDDGSVDNSKEICLEYQRKYPDNIIVLSQENSGQAIARNNGLQYVKGKYVNFLDSDDYISDNTLIDVLNFFNAYEYEIDMLAIPIKFCERLNNYHILNKKFNRQRVIDLKNEPNNPQLSASSAFFKYNLFPKFQFSVDMVTSEDSMMINKILLEKQKYGVINSATYYYRKRYDESSTIDNSVSKKEFYTEKLRNYFLALMEYSYSKFGEVPLFIQYLVAYDIQWVIKESELKLLNSFEKEEFLSELTEITKQLNPSVVFDNAFIAGDEFKNYFYNLIISENKVSIKEDTVTFNIGKKQIDNLKNHTIWLDIVEIKDDFLNISGFMNSYFSHKNIVINAVKEDLSGNILGEYSGNRVEYTVREDIKFLEQDWQYKYNFDIKVPINESERSIVKLVTRYVDEDSGSSLISCNLNVNFNSSCRLSVKNKYIVKDSYILTFHDNIFELEEYKYEKMSRYNAEVCKTIRSDNVYDFKNLIKLRNIYTKLYNLKKKYYKKPLYLFMDRTNHADDNAEHLFRYAVKQNDNIRKYFVVEDGNEYNRLKKIGKTLKYNSFKHRLIYLLADKVISSHPDEFVLNPFFEIDQDQRRYINSLVTSDTYFLQHGVTLGNVSDWLRKFDKNVSLIVALSDDEHDSFLEKGYNYDESIIQTLGFPRYDNLKSDSKKQILFIPTWRNYLESNEDIFINSNYFKNICNLLNNKRLLEILDKNGFKIVFKPHPRLENKIPHSEKRFIDLFNINEKVEISWGKSYQELFKESNLLITDYSSVAFDFAYLKKPIIYYQAEDDYHHGKSYFDFKTMGFGDIISDENVLLSKINDYLNSNCTMEDKYIERVDKFFKFIDKNNCKRVYDWIKEH